MSNAKTKVAKKKKEQIAYSKISLNELKFVEGDLVSRYDGKSRFSSSVIAF